MTKKEIIEVIYKVGFNDGYSFALCDENYDFDKWYEKSGKKLVEKLSIPTKLRMYFINDSNGILISLRLDKKIAEAEVKKLNKNHKSGEFYISIHDVTF